MKVVSSWKLKLAFAAAAAVPATLVTTAATERDTVTAGRWGSVGRLTRMPPPPPCRKWMINFSLMLVGEVQEEVPSTNQTYREGEENWTRFLK